MKVEDAGLYLTPHLHASKVSVANRRGSSPQAPSQLAEHWRPRVRSECPKTKFCPYVGCRYHLYLDVNASSGSLKLNFDGVEPWHLEASCALDVADAHDEGLKLSHIGRLMGGLTKERIRQIEAKGLEFLRSVSALTDQ